MGADTLRWARRLILLVPLAAIAADWPQPWPAPWPAPRATAVDPQPSGEAVLESPYARAHRRHIERRERLVVLIGADWCPGCVALRPLHTDLERLGAFVYVDYDRDRAVAQAVLRQAKTDSIPLLAIYYWQGERQRMAFVGPNEIRAAAESGVALP